MTSRSSLLVVRILGGHKRIFGAVALGALATFLLPHHFAPRTRLVMGWDFGCLAFLLLCGTLFAGATAERMERHARLQQEGEWSLFWLVLAGATASLAVIAGEFQVIKGAPAEEKALRIALVAGTLALSWLLMQVVFALRYAHEFYTRTEAEGRFDGGLDFPKCEQPDYWDFLYFSCVLGMTFQVSDVEITSRKFRRLATLHGLLGYVFNTVILALTINLASGALQ